MTLPFKNLSPEARLFLVGVPLPCELLLVWQRLPPHGKHAERLFCSKSRAGRVWTDSKCLHAFPSKASGVLLDWRKQSPGLRSGVVSDVLGKPGVGAYHPCSRPSAVLPGAAACCWLAWGPSCSLCAGADRKESGGHGCQWLHSLGQEPGALLGSGVGHFLLSARIISVTPVSL